MTAERARPAASEAAPQAALEILPSLDDRLDALRHDHVFLGARHAENERRTWSVIVLCGVMLVVEIGAGLAFHSMALLADGIHMATHAGAMLLAAGAYFYARKHSRDPRFSWGAGKIGDLAAFGSAVFLASTALLVGIESVERLIDPQPIAFNQALPVAVLALLVNLASAWLLRADHDHHDPAAKADEGGESDHHHHHDHNLRAAYVHVVSDAAVSLLAIFGLLAGRQLGWIWMDPLMGIIGAYVIARWSFSLLKITGAVLLDMSPGEALPKAIRARLEAGGDRVADLHVWRVGPGHNAAAVTVLSATGEPPSAYHARLAGVRTLSHVTIEVEPLSGT